MNAQTKLELANAVRAAKTVEGNARELQTQIENLKETVDHVAIFEDWFGKELIDAAERVQEAVFEIARFRDTLERRADSWGRAFDEKQA